VPQVPQGGATLQAAILAERIWDGPPLERGHPRGFRPHAEASTFSSVPKPAPMSRVPLFVGGRNGEVLGGRLPLRTSSVLPAGQLQARPPCTRLPHTILELLELLVFRGTDMAETICHEVYLQLVLAHVRGPCEPHCSHCHMPHGWHPFGLRQHLQQFFVSAAVGCAPAGGWSEHFVVLVCLCHLQQQVSLKVFGIGRGPS
jgi:hypothetical protein